MVTAPALSAQRGVLRDLLQVLDLQQGIRFGGQLRTARVFIAALEQLLALQAGSEPPNPQARDLASAFGGSSGGWRGAAGARARGTKKAKGGLTKRERQAASELEREGWIGAGAVDPSPQRTTVAVAACLSLLLES